MSKVYSEQIAKTQLLLTGLKKNAALLKNKGIDEQFIGKLENDSSLAATIDQEKDKLKAEVKTKTIQAYAKMREIQKQVLAAKKIIKSDFDKSKWLDFGIADKK